MGRDDPIIDPVLGCRELLSPPLVEQPVVGTAQAPIHHGNQLFVGSGSHSSLRAMFTAVGSCASPDGSGEGAAWCLGCDCLPTSIISARRETLVHSTIYFGNVGTAEEPVQQYLDSTLHLRTAPAKRNDFWVLAHHPQAVGSSEPGHWHFVHKCRNWSMLHDECRCKLLAQFRGRGCEINRRTGFYSTRGDIIQALLYLETGGRFIAEIYSAGIVARRSAGVEGADVSAGRCLSAYHGGHMLSYQSIVPREAMVRWAPEEDAQGDGRAAGASGGGSKEFSLGDELDYPQAQDVNDDDFDEVVFDKDTARWSLSAERLRHQEIAKEQLHVQWLAGVFRREFNDDKENKKKA